LYPAPVKLISKKEQKRLEDEEFAKLMSEVPVESTTTSAAVEESKTSAVTETVDEKKRAANLKKK